jgi:hypothetical protein
MSPGLLHRLPDEALRARRVDQLSNALRLAGDDTYAQLGMRYDRVSEQTHASAWHAASGGALTDELLDWPPDMLGPANVITARWRRFCLVGLPTRDWPPKGYPDCGRMVKEAGPRWGGARAAPGQGGRTMAPGLHDAGVAAAAQSVRESPRSTLAHRVVRLAIERRQARQARKATMTSASSQSDGRRVTQHLPRPAGEARARTRSDHRHR